MRRLRAAWLRVTGLFRKNSDDQELADELAAHLQLHIGDNLCAGMTLEAARRDALLRLGGALQTRESYSDRRGVPLLEHLRRDLHYAVRQLRTHPTFTFTAVATLALCLGANTAIFSIVQAVLFRPLPYPHPEQLVELVTAGTYGGGNAILEDSHDGEEWKILSERVTALDLAAYSMLSSGVNLVTHQAVTYIHQERVSANFFHVLGIEPRTGRGFSPDDDRTGAPSVVILSDDLWNTQFGRDQAIVGQTVMLRGELHTIVGIMPPGFRTDVVADVWTPLRPIPPESRGQNYQLIGRLRANATAAQAEAEIAAASHDALRHYAMPADVQARLAILPLQRGLTDSVRTPLLLVWGAVALVLLIGCLNVAGLLIARGAVRRREIATRLALGGTRTAIVRQLFVEAGVLVACGGLLGVLLAVLALQAFGSYAAGALPVWSVVRLNSWVVGVAALAITATTLLCGCFPALQAARIDLHSALVDSGRGIAGSARHWTRRLLVGGELALTATLLVASILLVRSFLHLREQPAGFETDHVVTATIAMQDARYTTADGVNQLFDASLARLRAIPGVESAAIVTTLPYQRALNLGFSRVDWSSGPSTGSMTTVSYVTPGYFETLRIPVHTGRSFSGQDGSGGAKVAVVNQAFVRRYFESVDPIGRHVGIAYGTREIVGVVGDVQQTGGSFDSGPLAALPAVYIPASQTSDQFLQMTHTWFSPQWVVRTAIDGQSLAGAMQHAIAATDPNLVFAGFQSVDDLRGKSLTEQRVEAVLFMTFALLAIGLAAIGTYGLMAHSVTERTRELGIRLALGATTAQALKAAALPGITLAFVGTATGCAAAWMLAGVFRRLVWGISTTDGLSFVSAITVLMVASGIATLLPSLRVLHVDPARTLRAE